MGEIHRPGNLKAGLELPFLTKKIKMNAGKFEQGELIEYDYSTEKGNKCTTVDNLFGVATDTFDVKDNEYITVYLMGIFNKNEIKKEKSLEWKDIEKAARPLNIFFK
ncbi:hypothetical protein [Fusobacterium hominis]|uniref:Uncharacterized protein n=1 Tax=Fusobacterium hominis TaxID=2764326 RepID=A0A7G9GXH7_9FUSO|nr:hypothetical protein [Fusobacterium hominis]QNM15509.1 hypothetical protein H9Q81_01320 [Fusobacterium hominis]